MEPLPTKTKLSCFLSPAPSPLDFALSCGPLTGNNSASAAAAAAAAASLSPSAAAAAATNDAAANHSATTPTTGGSGVSDPLASPPGVGAAMRNPLGAHEPMRPGTTIAISGFEVECLSAGIRD